MVCNGAATGEQGPRVVVRRTFIEVLSDSDAAAPRRSRRANTEPALRELGVEGEDLKALEADVSTRATGEPEGSPVGELACFESFDSSLHYSAGSSAPPTPSTGAGGMLKADMEQLLSENARLNLENQLLRQRARLLHGADTATQPPTPVVAPTCAASKPLQDEAPAAARTTLMLRNLPSNYTRATLLGLLDAEGFSGCYDFVYLPRDFNSGACLGYAFINLVHPSHADRFWRSFDGFSKWMMPSRKVCRVSWSGPHQGFEAHVARYRDSPVMHESVLDDYKPALFSQGRRVAFPGPVKAPRAPRVRRRGDAGRRPPRP